MADANQPLWTAEGGQAVRRRATTAQSSVRSPPAKARQSAITA
jgi:hypothetical protein